MKLSARRLVLPDRIANSIAIEFDAEGTVVSYVENAPDAPADHALDTAVPAFANTHSHAFHRLLRGRTNGGGGAAGEGTGDFWTWRERMYAAVRVLDPELMYRVAGVVYSEMVAAGYSAVGEFHYVHHRLDGTPYPGHEMELAVASAAREAGIRLTLLDTLYLRAGFGRKPDETQRRFSDGTADAWLERWHALRDALRTVDAGVTLGAAIHSVRAVSPDDIAAAVADLPADVPLHVHLSEQPAENDECLAATGLTPTAVLDRAGALTERTTVVHATYLTPDDIAVLGARGVAVSMCPSTEGDLGDGLGRARALADAGARVTIGSDQNVTVDPFEELRLLEHGARLASGRRGVFSPTELWHAGARDGHRALQPLGAVSQQPRVGHPLDLVEVDARSLRTAGSHPAELLFSATAADVRTVITRGAVRGPADPQSAVALFRDFDIRMNA